MANHGVLKLDMVMAKNVDSLNRSAFAGSATDIDNGYAFQLLTKGSGSSAEAWVVSAASSATGDMWMACSPEIPDLVNGTKVYRGLSPDPRDFYNRGGYVFDAFKPQVGDIITLSADGISGSPSSGSYVNAVSGSYILAWGAGIASTTLTLKLIKETYISLATGAIDDQRELAYQLEVIAN